MRILIVEDNPEGLAVIEQGLSECGHDTACAEDFDAGLSLAREGTFDVLVIDRMLPGGDGLDIVKTLRAQNIQTPAIFLDTSRKHNVFWTLRDMDVPPPSRSEP